MNGEPLNRDHGAPFRLIVPHWYAVASVKWLKRIDAVPGRVPDAAGNVQPEVPPWNRLGYDNAIEVVHVEVR